MKQMIFVNTLTNYTINIKNSLLPIKKVDISIIACNNYFHKGNSLIHCKKEMCFLIICESTLTIFSKYCPT